MLEISGHFNEKQHKNHKSFEKKGQRREQMHFSLNKIWESIEFYSIQKYF